MHKFGTEKWALNKVFQELTSESEFRDCHRNAGNFIGKVMRESNNLGSNTFKLKVYKTSMEGIIAHTSVLINNRPFKTHFLDNENELDDYVEHMEIELNNIIAFGQVAAKLQNLSFDKSLHEAESVFDDFFVSSYSNPSELGFDKKYKKDFLKACVDKDLLSKKREEKTYQYYSLTEKGMRAYLDYVCLKSSATSFSNEKISRILTIISGDAIPLPINGIGSIDANIWLRNREEEVFVKFNNFDLNNKGFIELSKEIDTHIKEKEPPLFEGDPFNVNRNLL